MKKNNPIQLSAERQAYLETLEKQFERLFFANTSIKAISIEKNIIHLAMEFDLNFSLNEIFKIIGFSNDKLNFSHDVVYAIHRFQELIYTLRSRFQHNAQLAEIALYFNNTTVILHSLEEIGFVQNIIPIIKAFIHHYTYLSKLKKQAPNIIHIPVFAQNPKSTQNFDSKYIMPLHSTYEQYWGLYFEDEPKPIIYNLPKNKLISGDFEFDW